MASSRLLVPLCGLLLALAVTAAIAGAPLYAEGELSLIAEADPYRPTRDSQVARCKYLGGSLVPIVSEAVYTLVTVAVDGTGAWNSFSYMGGSTILSPVACTSLAPSIECIWYWDQGRYTGVENVLPFYRGNRDAKNLVDAGMMTTSVNNHWRVVSDDERCPCYKMERYGAVLRDKEGLPYWSDTGSSSYSYASSMSQPIYELCGIDTTMTTTTKAPSGVANRPLVVGLPVAVALVVMAVVA